jgi:hypothetical protein
MAVWRGSAARCAEGLGPSVKGPPLQFPRCPSKAVRGAAFDGQRENVTTAFMRKGRAVPHIGRQSRSVLGVFSQLQALGGPGVGGGFEATTHPVWLRDCCRGRPPSPRQPPLPRGTLLAKARLRSIVLCGWYALVVADTYE